MPDTLQQEELDRLKAAPCVGENQPARPTGWMPFCVGLAVGGILHPKLFCCPCVLGYVVVSRASVAWEVNHSIRRIAALLSCAVVPSMEAKLVVFRLFKFAAP